MKGLEKQLGVELLIALAQLKFLSHNIMMKKNLFKAALLVLLSAGGAQAQTGNFGIGTTSPTKRLDVDGDARVRNLPAGTTSDNVVTTDVNGNLRQVAAPLFNEVIKGQVVLPPASVADFSNNSNTAYDNADFKVISKSTSAANQGGGVAIVMTCVYEYNGTAMSSTSGAYAFICPFNNTGYPDVFTGNMTSLQNVGSGAATRTRITIRYTRTDSPYGSWGGTFGSSVLIVR